MLFFIVKLNLSLADDGLTSAIKDYATLKNEIDRILSAKTVDCSMEENKNQVNCSYKNFCDILSKNKDQAVIYSDKSGGTIYNSNLDRDAKILKACLAETLETEIQAKTADIIKAKKLNHIKKISDLNKKLKTLLLKNNENAKLQIINSEIINLSLLFASENRTINWDKKDASTLELEQDISRAEKNTKTKLTLETKKTLIEMHQLIMNPIAQEEEKEIFESLFPDVKNNNIFYNWSLLTDAKKTGSKKKLESNQALYQKKVQEAYNTFKEVKENMISYLENLKNNENKNEINRSIEKLKTIKFNPPTLSHLVTSNCETPNAFYSSQTHSFTLCPQYLENPKIVLIETIAHELAHSFDPCNLSSGLTKKLGPEIIEEAPFDVKIKVDSILGNYSAYPYDEKLSSKNIFQAPMKFSDNPFKSVIQCLQTSESVDAKILDQSELKKKLTKTINEIKENGLDDNKGGPYKYYDFLEKNLDSYLEFKAGCNLKKMGIDMGLSQIQEAFADKIAVDITAKEISKLNKSEAEDKILAIIANYSEACPNLNNVDNKLVELATKYQCPDFFASKSTEQKIIKGLIYLDQENTDSHANDEKRINRILLAHPEIQKILGCEQKIKGVKYCE